MPHKSKYYLRVAFILGILTLARSGIAGTPSTDADDISRPATQIEAVDVTSLESQFEASTYGGKFLDTVQGFADAMMAHGRDTYGEGKMASGDSRQSGLFLSAMDRVGAEAPAPLTEYLPAAPNGVRAQDRVSNANRNDPNQRLVGSDLGDNQHVLRALMQLSALTGDPSYAQAAKDNIAWYFRNARSGKNGEVKVATGLLAWGEHTSWDVFDDDVITPYVGQKPVMHEFTSDWLEWPLTYQLAPEDATDYALGLWNWQINDQATGDFCRHGYYDGIHGHSDEYDFPRHGSYYIHAFAAALAHTENAELKDTFRTAIKTVVGRFEDKKATAAASYGAEHALIQLADQPLRNSDRWSTGQTLEYSSALQRAALLIDPSLADPLADRLWTAARAEDSTFLAFDHQPDGSGFIDSVTISTLGNVLRTDAWGLGYGKGGAKTHVYGTLLIDRIALLRETTHPTDVANRKKFEDLLVQAADFYRDTLPDVDGDGDIADEAIWNEELANVIDLQLAAYEITGQPRYLKQASDFGHLALDMFWGEYALPRASTDVDHYEAITGAGYLLEALLKLHVTLTKS